MMARLFALTVLVYPLALTLLCVGAGLLADRASGSFVPVALVPSVGAATLIGVSQLSTYSSVTAPAAPYVLLAVALAGWVLGRARVRSTLAALVGREAGRGRGRDAGGRRGGGGAGRRVRRVRATPALALVLGPLAYALAIAPVLLSGRASFSSFMALSDSAVHMLGADYLVHHGQQYAHLDMRNSYARFLTSYYGAGYPSGADTLYGGSSLLLGLPLLWTFQPFNALALALASGPAWELARRLGLRRASAALAALVATVPALVYGYALIGSIKELIALTMSLTLGALVVCHRRWLARGARRAAPFALVLAAGVSALGVGFGVWGLAAAVVLAVALLAGLATRTLELGGALATVLAGALVLGVAAWPTWRHVSASLNVAHAIATTGNAGNLHEPLRWTQAFGVWLRTTYKQAPGGAWAVLTYALIALALLSCVLGAAHLLRTRRFVLAGWIAASLLAWAALARSATTWVDAKALVLSSPVVVLLAWGGVAALRAASRAASRRVAERQWMTGMRSARARRGARGPRIAAAALALLLAAGALASDAAQYHASNLAPTARYEELASINRRFGRAGNGPRHGGPTLFTDFDEYSLYALRDLDVGGPDFVYPPPALASLAGGYGDPVRLDRATPAQLAEYRLIVTRRDPSAPTPPAPFALVWEGRYYQVWERRAGAAPAVRVTMPIVRITLRDARRPRDFGRERAGWAMHGAGTLSVAFTVPRTGAWTLWLQGQFMPRVTVAVDGRRVASLRGQLSGNSLVPDTAPPIALPALAAGRHVLSVTRGGFSLVPGNGGSAVLAGAFLTAGTTPARGVGALPRNVGSIGR